MANDFSRLRVAKVSYSFAVDGGAVSTIEPITYSDIIPTGAIITNVVAYPSVALTSGGSATVSITGGGLTILAAGAYSSAPYNGTTPAQMAQSTGLTSTAPYIPQIATSSAPLKVVIGTAALTAGIFDVYVTYVL